MTRNQWPLEIHELQKMIDQGLNVHEMDLRDIFEQGLLILKKIGLYAKILSENNLISDEAYDADTWDGVINVSASKNAIRDKLETMGEASISDDAYDESDWDDVTDIAPSKNAARDEFEKRATKASPTFTGTITIGNAEISEAELEILDGATLSTADLNIIDGISDSGSLTAAELLYLDGVTSAIQDQIDDKADKGANADITSMTALTQITRATGGAFDIAIGGAVGDNFTIDSDKVLVQGSTGNVGLGMTPLQKLSVNGRLTGLGLSRGAADKSFVFAGGTTDADGGKISLYGESHASAPDEVRINTNAIAVKQDRKVGFGVTDPGDVIDVNGRIRMRESSDPGAVADRGWIYTKDVSGTAEVFASDAAANAQQLTPHAFELFEPDPDEPYPWSYYAENKAIGIRINVDMTGMVRAVEGLTGKQFIFYKDIEKSVDLEANYREAWKKEWIEENTIEEEVLRNDAFALVEVETQGEQTGEKVVGYELEGTIVKEKKEPVFGMKKVYQHRLKADISFNEEDGRFYRKIIPTELEANEAAKVGFEFDPPKWMADRLNEVKNENKRSVSSI